MEREKNSILHIPVIPMQWIVGMILLLAVGCKSKPSGPVLFEVLKEAQTGIAFANRLTPTQEFNMFKYMYFYNGSGIGAGDFNNDGLTDLFFASNQGENALYLNTGGMHFRDVTREAHLTHDGSWSTGVSVVDINNDGMLDIYVCRVGKYETLKGHNLLLICTGIRNGIPQYAERSAEYGLDFSGFSTQAAFFDYDRDGDLDMFLLNHSVHQNGSFAERNHFLGTYSELSGDRMYRNDGNHFTDVTKASGINSSAISYGLGMVVSDIDLDGYPDIYVGNDFHENDYLYINQHNGTFKDVLTDRLMHTSQFSMGVDVADVNNDGYPDITSMDMLPSDPYILKRSEGEDTYDIFNMKIQYGYHYQYTRNNLQLNRRNGMFSETGLYSGIAATDWSWASLFMDFDNDGRKDLFISNGIPKRMNDIDYINFVSDGAIQEKIRANNLAQTDMTLIDKFPQIKIPNKFYRNEGNMVFTDMAGSIQGDLPTFSNGAIYADLDNDGDLDIVVNNIDEPVMIYANRSNDNKSKPYASVTLKGSSDNVNATGARLVLFTGDSIRTYEKSPVRGFLSSMETPLHVGLSSTKIDSAFLVWPDNTFQQVVLRADSSRYTFTYRKGLPPFDGKRITGFYKSNVPPMEDIAAASGLRWLHTENDFNEFNREPLIPHMVSTEGPALAVADINGDGLEDVFIGGAKLGSRAVFVQQPGGRFARMAQPALAQDSVYEDVDACWVDVNSDGHPDLVVASGGNEYYGQEAYLQPRVYLNNGKGLLQKLEHAFDNIFMTASVIVPYDFNGDGFTDLFVGGRAVPFAYGQTPPSYLLQNDGKGRFRDVTRERAPGLANAGMVTNAVWVDINHDHTKDLLVCSEWGGIDAYLNTGGSFKTQVLTHRKGWWNFLLPVDIDNDGDIDLVAGNLGQNSRLKASSNEPVRLYYADFDGNGKKEQLLTYYVDGREIPFANKAELEKQLPVMKKKFLYAEDFAKAKLNNIFSSEQLKQAQQYSADYFSNAVLINDGKMNFTLQALPWEAQLSSFRDAVVIDANNDALPDILLGGNYYGNNIQMGRYDADYGSILVNKGGGHFSVQTLNGVSVKGQVRKIRRITVGKKEALLMARNNDSTVLITQR